MMTAMPGTAMPLGAMNAQGQPNAVPEGQFTATVYTWIKEGKFQDVIKVLERELQVRVVPPSFITPSRPWDACALVHRPCQPMPSRVMVARAAACLSPRVRRPVVGVHMRGVECGATERGWAGAWAWAEAVRVDEWVRVGLMAEAGTM